jgi:predicted nucleotide-binding protein
MGGVYLPLEKITSGKQLVDILGQIQSLDFDYQDVDDETKIVLITELHEICTPKADLRDISERFSLGKTITALLNKFESQALAVSAATFVRTCHDVDDEDSGMPILMAKWDETCLVLRVHRLDESVISADVSKLVDGYNNSDDPQLLRTQEILGKPMFNVMVTGGDNLWETGAYEWSRERVLEHTTEAIKIRLGALGEKELEELLSLPTLFMYEQSAQGNAKVGTIKRIQQRSGREFRVIFEFDDSVPPMTIEQIADIKWDLGLADFEFSRTHWAVKEGDLYKILTDAKIIVAPKPEIFEPQEIDPRPTSVEVLPSKVFLVHGRDDGKKNAVARFLEARAGLQVIILSERPNKGRSILTKFEEEAGEASYAIILMTPDDIGHLRPELETNDITPSTPQHRARQNVIFELGFFIGRLGVERVCALIPAGVEKPSDFDGIVYIHLDNDDGWQKRLVTELHAADVPISSNWWQAS